MILRVSRLGHPVLRTPATDLDPEAIRRGEYRQLIRDMFETMAEYDGVGLAGPQVHLSSRIFVFAVDEKVAKRRKVEPLAHGVMFNARYEPVGEEKVTDWEGCLSVPLLGGEVPRYKRIKVTGVDLEGNAVAFEVHGFTARIFQHEIDHTDGLVYLDRMPDLKSLGYTVLL